jgi:hypothetical protein
MKISDKFRDIEHITKQLKHPFVLLIIGALISSLIIPYFTRQWQDNQKQLELKTALADDINKAVSDSIVSSRDGYQADSSFTTYKSWEISKETIGSKIGAYFSDHEIRLSWNNLSSAVEQLSYYVLGNGFPKQNDTNYNYNVCNRLAHVLKLYTSYPLNNPINIDRNVLTKYNCNQFYIPVLNLQDLGGWKKDQKYFPIREGVDWNALFYFNQTNYNNFQRSFFTLQNYTENHKNTLLEQIFKTPITVFR